MNRPLSHALATLLLVTSALFAQDAPLVGGLKDLRELDRQLIAMAPTAQEATVALVSRAGRGSGSGVIVSADGLVMTAAHVTASLSDEVVVILADGRRFEAKKLGADFDRDAALVQITEEGTFVHAELGDSKALRRNDWCVAVGHPGGYDPGRKPPFRLGRVLSSGNFLVTDCAVVGGDSGGPLLDPSGRVIGIHSNIGMSLSQNRHVPVTAFTQQWDELKAGRRQGSRFAGRRADRDSNRVVLGIGVTDDSQGRVEITRVLPGSPAAKAGLKARDIILQVEENEIEDRRQLVRVVNNFKPGKKVQVKALRDGQERSFEVKLVRQKDLENASKDDANPPAEEDSEGEDGDQAGDEKEAAPKDDDSTRKSDEELDRFLEKQMGNLDGGSLKLQLTPDEIEKFGGMERLMERLRKLVEAKREERRSKADSQDSEKPKPSAEPSAKGDRKPSGASEKSVEGAEGDSADDPKPEKKTASLSDAKALELLREAMKNGGKLQMDNEEAERFGGADAVSQRLAELMKSMKPAEMRKLLESGAEAAADDFFASSMRALRPVVRKNRPSTVEVWVDDQPVALGTIVEERGWFVTKDTETTDGEVRVRWKKKDFEARRIGRFPKYDLAIYAIEEPGERFRPVTWVPADELHLGALLATPGGDGEPIGIGMVSVLPRPLGGVGFLGITTAAEGDTVVVGRVVEGGAAEKAGLEVGDRLLKLGDWEVTDTIAFSAKIREYRAGEKVKLEILRDDQVLSKTAELGERPSSRGGRRFRRMNQMSGPMSERTSGFPEVLQHDIPLQPELCGGPLLDLRGRCVGVNVSRAGRVKTYAIPGSVVRELVGSIREDLPSDDDDLRAARELIEEVRANLTELEKRLETLEAR